MDGNLTFKEHHNRCMNKARAAEPRLRVLTRMHGIVPERVRAVQIGCVQAVALYGSELWWDPKEFWETRGSSTRSESAGQINSGRSAHDATRSTHERFRTDTCASSPRLQAATIRDKARKRMRRLEAKGDVQPPQVWRTDMQSHQERARMRRGGRDDALAPPGRRTGGQDGHTER